MKTIKIHWNYVEKKWNLIKIGTEIPKENFIKGYVVTKEMSFIDPNETWFLRTCYKIHLILKHLKRKLKWIF
jgi:hypothetical protein